MVKIRSGLLVALVLLLMVGLLSSREAGAGGWRAFCSESKTQGSPTNEGEPDAGQTTKPPPGPSVRPVKPYRASIGGKNGVVGQARFIRWTTGFWMARYLGAGF